MSEETIVLPRSGVVLRSEGGRAMFFRPPLGIDAAVLCPRIDNIKPTAMFAGECIAGDTEADCIAWLDARVLALRAALPPDARERVLKVLRRFDGTSSDGHLDNVADAVLAALGGGA